MSSSNSIDYDELVPFLIKKENKDKLIEIVNDLIKENKPHTLKKLIEKIEEHVGYSLNSNVDKLIANYQEAVVFPLKQDTPKYPRSGRPITTMKKILSKGVKSKSELDILKDFHIDKNCFCMNVPIGEINQPIYIPVIRFAQSNASGYYGFTKNSDANFTWYYIEPDSNYLLLSKKSFVARNKIQAFLMLNQDETHYLRNTAMKLINNYLDEIGFIDYLSDEQLLELFINDKEIKIVNDFTNYFRKLLDTDTDYYKGLLDIKEFLKEKGLQLGSGTIASLKQKGIIFYGTGGMDIFDEEITDLAREQGYDILILTHQSGNSARLVSELVDTRFRQESLNNIYA